MKKIGFVGLGLMGSAMARRLLSSGYSLVVHNRTKSKAGQLVKEGAVWSDTPAEAAAPGIIVTMISDDAALNHVALGESGILGGLPHGGVHIDSSTVSPNLTKELSSVYRQQGKEFLHCPVLGSVPQAAEGALLIMAGGSREALNSVDELLHVLGQRIWKFDAAEQASHAKLLCNSFIAGMIVTLTQAIVFSQKASVDPRILLEIIGDSALNSPMVQTKGRNILAGNFEARFFTEHMLKDVDLMLDAARSLGTGLPVVETARKLLIRTVEMGFGKDDYSSVIKALEQS